MKFQIRNTNPGSRAGSVVVLTAPASVVLPCMGELVEVWSDGFEGCTAGLSLSYLIQRPGAGLSSHAMRVHAA